MVSNEPRAAGEESPIVGSKICQRHVAVTSSTLGDHPEIMESITAVFIEVGVTLANCTLELWPLVGLVGRDMLPGIALGASITTGPSDGISLGESGTGGKFRDVLKEGVKT